LTAAKVLFVTWDGPQVSYLQSLFLPIFKGLAQRGHSFHVLQFTWGAKAEQMLAQDACEAAGCSYRSIPVLRTPVAAGSLVTAALGSRPVGRAVAEHAIDIVLPRSTLPALATRLALRSLPSVGVLLDADGLPHDERVDFDGWSAEGLAYRLLRDLESAAVRRADAVLTRSRKAIDILCARAGAGTDPAKFHVVTNGRDAELFRPALAGERAAVRRELGIDGSAPLLVYAGSIGPQYCVPEMLTFFRLVLGRRSDAKLLLLTGSPDAAEHSLDGFADLRSSCHVLQVPSGQVPRYLGAGDLGLALRRPSFSMQAVAPIKLGEYLLCGLPVLATRAIGDTDQWIPDGAGRRLASMSAEELTAAAEWFVDVVLGDAGFGVRCRQAGLRNFSLDASIDAYAGALDAIGARA